VWQPALCCMKRQERESEFTIFDFRFSIYDFRFSIAGH
jgi:hypothetical protein